MRRDEKALNRLMDAIRNGKAPPVPAEEIEEAAKPVQDLISKHFGPDCIAVIQGGKVKAYREA